MGVIFKILFIDAFDYVSNHVAIKKLFLLFSCFHLFFGGRKDQDFKNIVMNMRINM